MLNHSSDIPLYIQLASSLESAIRDGVYKDGSKLPSENKLCREHGVSRITVRQAISLLEQKELTYTVHGKGTFVRIPRLDQRLLKIVKFSKMLEEKGLHGYSRVLSFNTKARNPEGNDIFKLDFPEPICRLEINGYAHGSPIVYYDSHFRADTGLSMYGAAMKREQLKDAFSTFDLYEDIGVQVGEINQVIRAANADRRIASILGIPKGSALIVLESMVMDSNRLPVEHKVGYYRNDMYSFKIKREM